MLKRELKINLKGLIIWSGVLSLILILVFCIYPSLDMGKAADSINALMDMFPKEILAAFNMDIMDIDTASGWLLTEGVVFIILLGAIYAGNLGSSILLKEESDKTIEFLYSKPVTKKKILSVKFFSGLIYVISFSLIIYIVNIIGLKISGSLDIKLLTLVSIGIVILHMVIYSVCFLLSTLFRKTRASFGISLIVVFLSYFLQIIGNMGSSVKIIKYFSIFELMPSRSIIINESIGMAGLVISISIIIVSYILSNTIYSKKEFL